MNNQTSTELTTITKNLYADVIGFAQAQGFDRSTARTKLLLSESSIVLLVQLDRCKGLTNLTEKEVDLLGEYDRELREGLESIANDYGVTLLLDIYEL